MFLRPYSAVDWRLILWAGSDMPGVILVFLGVTSFLPLEIDRILFHVRVKHIISAHSQHLRKADEKVEQIHNFNLRILGVKPLISGPPFPRHAVGQLGYFLRHGPAVVQNPFDLLFLAHSIGPDSDAFVQGLLHPEQLSQFVWLHVASIPAIAISGKKKMPT